MSTPRTPPAELVANLEFRVAGQRIPVALPAPNRPVSPEALLPAYRILADAIEKAAVSTVKNDGLAISCRAGCGALLPAACPDCRGRGPFPCEVRGRPSRTPARRCPNPLRRCPRPPRPRRPPRHPPPSRGCSRRRPTRPRPELLPPGHSMPFPGRRILLDPRHPTPRLSRVPRHLPRRQLRPPHPGIHSAR